MRGCRLSYFLFPVFAVLSCSAPDNSGRLQSVRVTEVEPVAAPVVINVFATVSIPNAGLPVGMVNNADGELGVIDRVAGHVFMFDEKTKSFSDAVGHLGDDPAGVRCLSGADLARDSVVIVDRCRKQFLFLRSGVELRRQSLELGTNSFAPPATLRFSWSGDRILVGLEPIGGTSLDETERRTPVRLAVLALQAGIWEPGRLIPLGTNVWRNVGSQGRPLFVIPGFASYVRWSYFEAKERIVVSNNQDYYLEVMDLSGTVTARISVSDERQAASRTERDSISAEYLSDQRLRSYVSDRLTEWPVQSRKAAVRDLKVAPDGALWVWVQVKRPKTLSEEGQLIDRFVFTNGEIKAYRFTAPCFPDAFVSARKFACLVDTEGLDPKVKIYAVTW